MMVPIPARPRFPPSSSTIGTAIGSVMKRGHMARPTSVGSDARRAKSAVKATETKPVEPAGRDVGARRVRLVREEGRDVSSQYGREGEGGGRVSRAVGVHTGPLRLSTCCIPPRRVGSL